MRAVICTACSDRLPRIELGTLGRSLRRLAQVEPSCDATRRALVDDGWEVAVNARHLDVNQNVNAVLTRARKLGSSDVDVVFVVSDDCVLDDARLIELWNLAGETFVVGDATTWAITRRNLLVVLTEWCFKRAREYWWCIRRSARAHR